MIIEIGAEIRIDIKDKISENTHPGGDVQKVLNKIEKANTFPNPQHAENIRMGYSNWGTPRKLELYRWEDGVLILPRGFWKDLMYIIKINNIEFIISDKCITNEVNYFLNTQEREPWILRNYQLHCVRAATDSIQGCIVSPTGSGKSLIGLEIMVRRGQKSLVLVHRVDLAMQWADVINKRLGLKCGLIAGDSWQLGEEITIAMIQSLHSRKDKFKEIASQFGLVLTDECHHIPSDSFYDVIAMIPAKYRYGLSATPRRRDGLEILIYRAIGPCIATVEREEVESLGATVPVTVHVLKTGFDPGLVKSWNDYLQAITDDGERNFIIMRLANLFDNNAKRLILVDRVEHAEFLSELMIDAGIDHVLAHGKIKKKDRSELMEKIKSARITVGATGLLGEGLDVSAWEILILASPISSEIKLLQAIGRVVRSCPGKEGALVYDLKDDCGFAGASFKKRLKIYNDNNIKVIL